MPSTQPATREDPAVGIDLPWLSWSLSSLAKPQNLVCRSLFLLCWILPAENSLMNDSPSSARLGVDEYYEDLVFVFCSSTSEKEYKETFCENCLQYSLRFV
jgi:hypothetical protein